MLVTVMKKWFRISLIVNWIMAMILTQVALLVFALPKAESINDYEQTEEGYCYLQNSQYEAYTSMFELSVVSHAKIVFVGDSITARGCFQEFFTEREIVNRGIGSDVAEGIYNRIDQIIKLRPEKIFIMVGVNDVYKAIDIEESIQFVRLTCEKIHYELPNTKIYIQSVLPTSDREYEESIRNLNEGYKQLSDELGIEYIDLYPLYAYDGEQKTELFCDGTHLNGSGYLLWINSIRDYIE